MASGHGRTTDAILSAAADVKADVIVLDTRGLDGMKPPQQYPEVDHPRLIEEHHVVGPHGEDEIEATDERGRRWYHLRSPRSSMDGGTGWLHSRS